MKSNPHNVTQKNLDLISSIKMKIKCQKTSLPSCESLVSVKENTNKKRNKRRKEERKKYEYNTNQSERSSR